MKYTFMALAGLALASSCPAIAMDRAPSPATKRVEAPAAADAPVLGAAAARVASWVTASSDNRALPYMIIDKPAATAFLFDGTGKPLAQLPVLLGIAIGDHSSPGVGKKKLAEIGPAEKTTPSGRFLAKFGLAVGRQQVLWVDYANSVALHPIPPGANPKERRRQRMLSPTSEDNRITFGCINVPSAFYAKSVKPLFRKKGGYVYVLPDQLPLEQVFPLVGVRQAPPVQG